MLKARKRLVFGLMVAVMSLTASPAFARSVSLKDAGFALWIFIAIGALIILLQLIPAAILFFSFIGTGSGMVFKQKKATGDAVAEGQVVLPGYEPAAIKE